MEDLSDYSSEVVEFLPTQQLGKVCQMIEACVSTDPEPLNRDQSVETTLQSHTSTQTEVSTTQQCQVDEQKLAVWLRKIYPAVEEQLLKGPTPLNTGYDSFGNISDTESKIQTYQKITMEGLENSIGIAAWLSVHTNKAPILVVSTKAPHDDWCDHLQQTLKLFVPKRMPPGNFVIFSEVKSIPLKACLSVLSTNAYNKSVFAGSSMDGEIHIWLCRSVGRAGDSNVNAKATSVTHEIDEMCCATSQHSYAVALDWLTENRLLSFHENGAIISWAVGKELLFETDFQLKVQANTSNEITSAVCLSSNTFVVGVKDGSIFICTITSFSAMRKQMEIIPLRKHVFTISTLLKTTINGLRAVVSCDLSGQVHCHSITNMDVEAPDVIQIPLPFKNVIASSKDGNIIYSPGIDGALECYNMQNGTHTIIDGVLSGKGNFITCSENGNWIITGLYVDDFQIFYVEH
ncbi:uncharacterized protein LOC101452544 [Ceratitis capitata]|uniref:uncharacterized protein LOC101452544 n=1 Tax=Ceratitis capitata TaxID=7213 RepID=UPI00061892A4|nr:uncharacterized protein LOC101452544 [Ceratitis capitata]